MLLWNEKKMERLWTFIRKCMYMFVFFFNHRKMTSHISTFKQEELPGSVFSSFLLTTPHVLQSASAVESPLSKGCCVVVPSVRVAPVCPVWRWGGLWICLRPAQTLRRGRDLCQDRVWVGLPRPWQTSLNCLNQSLHMLTQQRWP